MKRDMFDEKTISPMLIADNHEPFDSPDYFYELKLDGIRCLTYLDNAATELLNKRNKRVSPIYPELSKIYKQVSKRCIIDGEIVVIKDGKPDFFEIQRRSLMADKFRIELAAKKMPVCFIAFDVLYIGEEPVTNRPLSWRLSALAGLVKETPELALSRYIENKGVDLYNAAESSGLEGVVAKRKDSLYYPGKRTKDWLKMKALLDDDFVVCGYYAKAGFTASVIIGSFDGDKLIYRGHVVLGVSRHDFKLMEHAQKTEKSMFYPDFPDFDVAVWLVPNLVCVVKYMERTKTGGLRQPVFKGLRLDKLPEECVL